MKAIYLIRHAKSSWKAPSIKDFDRPLNERGKNDAPKIGTQLNELGFTPDLILCSPAKRTQATAKLICKQTNIDTKHIELTPSIYEASLSVLINLITDLPNQYNEIALIGHNPAITYFYNYLTDDHLSNVPTCGALKIELDITQWNEIIQGMGSQKFYIYPKML